MSGGGGGIIIPDPSTWVQQNIYEVYNAKTADGFDRAFERFVADDASIMVNGRRMSRADYKTMMRGEIEGETRADVTFNKVVSVPFDDKGVHGTGAVGVAFKADMMGKYMVLGHKKTRTVNSTMNVVVTDQAAQGGRMDDMRCVTSLDEVMTEKECPPK